MDLYADINFYLNAFGGTENGAARFPFFAAKATQFIKMYTGSNVDEANIPDCVKMCCCELVQLLANEETAAQENGGVKSESVGEWSKTFECTEERQQQLHTAMEQSVLTWLSGSGLLFRGIRVC